jgi:lipopolysaccharide/colanic/teichoic acid biosynthesis glycosyltransferase
MQVVGFVDDFKPVGAPVTDDLHVLGRPSALHEIARQTGAHEVIVISGAVAWETFEELIGQTTQRNGYTVRLSPGFYELLSTGVAVTSKSFVPLLTVDASRLVGADALLKGVLDSILGLLALLLCSPLLLGLTAARLAWRVQPPWRGERALGRHGQPFTRHRLAPRPGCSPSADPLSRLPELLDVLTGKLSLVGPRPRLVDEAPVDPLVAGMLQSVKPGVLGPWLVSEPVSAEQELRDELHYIRNWTIWLDVQIFVQTPLQALRAARRRLFAPPAQRGS